MFEITKSLEAIGRKLGVKYHFKSPVDEIIVDAGRAVGIRIQGKVIKADIVISNADLHFTETALLPTSAQSYPADYWQKRQAGPSALLLYLGIRGKVPELTHHNLFFTKAWKQNFDDINKNKVLPKNPSIYVCKPSATDASVAPKGHENIFVLVPLPPGLSSSDSEVNHYVDKTISLIEEQAGIADLAERIVTKTVRTPQFFGDQFHAWQNTALGMSHTLRQSAFFRPRVQSRKVPNLYYVGAGTQPGIGVPMCLISAELVYKTIIGDTSPGPLKEQL